MCKWRHEIDFVKIYSKLWFEGFFYLIFTGLGVHLHEAMKIHPWPEDTRVLCWLRDLKNQTGGLVASI